MLFFLLDVTCELYNMQTINYDVNILGAQTYQNISTTKYELILLIKYIIYYLTKNIYIK